MKALIRNYRGKSYLDPMMTLRTAFSDIEPADLGAENPVSDYGVRLERAGDFVVTWHELHRTGTRLVVTTNLTTSELDARYGGRVFSRLKDLCVPLRLNGGDKRTWTTGGVK